MPFTLAHPALVLPLKRFCPQYAVFAALVAGSMAPDIPYFFYLWRVGGHAHKFPGIFLLSIPIGICMLWSFYFIGPAAAKLLPTDQCNFVRSWVTTKPTINIKYVVLVLISLLVGIASHIIWDSFTHAYGWSVSELPVLTSSVGQIGSTNVKIYKLLQHGSSIFGLIIVGLAYLRSLHTYKADRHDVTTYPFSLKTRTLAFTIPFVIALAWALPVRSRNLHYLDVELVEFVIDYLDCLVVLITTLAIAKFIKNKIRTQQTAKHIEG